MRSRRRTPRFSSPIQPSLKRCWSRAGCAARCPDGSASDFRGAARFLRRSNKLGRDELKLPLVESFGQSELGGFVALGFPDLEPDDRKLVRIGPPLPDKDVAVVDANDRPLPPNRIGELILRGGFMAGYWNNPAKTAEATRGGWLRTGDVGLLDEDGFVTMRGRRSELIEVNGVSWYPRDVEEALCRVAGVRQAALIGLPDATLGRRPHAFVTLHDAAAISSDALKAEILGQVTYDLASVVDRGSSPDLPMTPTGKISKSELVARLGSVG